MNRDHEESNQRLLNVKQREVNDLTLANKRLETKLKQAEFLADARYDMAETYRKKLINSDQWVKGLAILAVTLFSFIFLSLREQSKKQKVIDDNTVIDTYVIKDTVVYQTYTLSPRLLDTTFIIPTTVFKHY